MFWRQKTDPMQHAGWGIVCPLVLRIAMQLTMSLKDFQQDFEWQGVGV